MDEPRAEFAATRWSLVARAASPNSPGAREALEELCRAYWWPLYVYLRRRGQTGDDAADLVQGLFAQLIERGRLAHVDPNCGRFRAWLLSALKFHLSHERERERAVKRGGRQCRVPLDPDEADRRWLEVSCRDQDAERLFERVWAISVLERALVDVEEQYRRDGRSAVFSALRSTLVGGSAWEDLRSIAVRLGTSTSDVKTSAFRLRKAFGRAIRAELASTLTDDSQVEDELRALFAALAAS
ncbi:MAG: RNA polymerase sigma factor [Planctomycetota bacterium]